MMIQLSTPSLKIISEALMFSSVIPVALPINNERAYGQISGGDGRKGHK